MALIFLAFFSISPAEIIRGIFTQNGIITFLPNLIDDIFQHGCFCPLLDETTATRSNFGGLQPIDELDAFCQAWHMDLACMRLAPMRCEYFTPVNALMDIATNFECISAESDCDRSHCELALIHGPNIVTYAMSRLITGIASTRPSTTGECIKSQSGVTRNTKR